MEVDEVVATCLAEGAPAEAAAAVVSALGPGLLGYLVVVLSNEDDAREVFAQVAEQVLTGIAAFRGESSVKTWTYRIAWRLAMRFERAPARRRARRLDTDAASALAQAVRDSTAAYVRTEAKDWLARVRASLSREDQSLLTLRFDRGMSWKETAEVMGGEGGVVDAARLRKRYERLKERLRRAAEHDGILPG